jgi:hypothetical protein
MALRQLCCGVMQATGAQHDRVHHLCLLAACTVSVTACQALCDGWVSHRSCWLALTAASGLCSRRHQTTLCRPVSVELCWVDKP